MLLVWLGVVLPSLELVWDLLVKDILADAYSGFSAGQENLILLEGVHLIVRSCVEQIRLFPERPLHPNIIWGVSQYALTVLQVLNRLTVLINHQERPEQIQLVILANIIVHLLQLDHKGCVIKNSICVSVKLQSPQRLLHVDPRADCQGNCYFVEPFVYSSLYWVLFQLV